MTGTISTQLGVSELICQLNLGHQNTTQLLWQPLYETPADYLSKPAISGFLITHQGWAALNDVFTKYYFVFVRIILRLNGQPITPVGEWTCPKHQHTLDDVLWKQWGLWQARCQPRHHIPGGWPRVCRGDSWVHSGVTSNNVGCQ